MSIFKNTYYFLDTSEAARPDFNTLRRWINEELDEFEAAYKDGNTADMYDAIVDANVFLANIAYHYGLLPEIIETYEDAVSVSNMTKFCQSESCAKSTVKAYQDGEHPNKPGVKIDADYRLNEDKSLWVIYNKADGKILKSLTFKDVDELLATNPTNVKTGN